ncbi:sphingomyelin phosphodiesterase isoform X1 [Achroia grisella]|uniref:sphingomyelin phosphodiesterase isoform X1 n=1 Tax=Achroia grisella TaxID=688607 RepID=UPI0027D282EC|nr:sphingomyelin phosphodiesterase isoform X1 [Achroia grisella]XP_059050872.1 sphingomyelin phosphodiesterase isoform X1 [Achroia grisella]
MIIRISWLLHILITVAIAVLVSGSPIFFQQTRDSKALIKWNPPVDEWNWTITPRNEEPFFVPSNFTHKLPPSANETELIAHMAALKRNYSRLLWDNDKSTNLPLFVEKALKLLNLKQVYYEVEHSVMSKVSCTACKAGAGLLQHYIKAGKSKDEITKMIYQFCVSLNIQSTRVCEGVTRLFGSEVVYVLKRITIGPNEICSFVIGDACGDVYNPYHEWEVSFPPVPKPSTRSLDIPVDKAPTFKVLQISDTHFDPYYAEGANAECNEPLCCRASSGPVLTPASGAGRWGDYRKCDTPKRTIDHMLKHIADTHTDIDYILWTGDLPPHDVWNQTKEENLKVLQETVAQMSDMFPGVPIFPALGNHESSPVNSFPPPYISSPESSIAWLYNELDAQWRRWLPAGVSYTVRRGAFYSVLVRPGFRIISVNMNYCNNKNWWLLMNSTDPATELQWLIYELQSAEFSGEKVHIIGHIPPGHSDCLKVWSRNYYAIINRYESTITAQFFGHTHFDEFEVFYDPNDLGRATNIAYVGPSVSPYYDLNLGYRIYYVDGDHDATTRQVVDHETWIMNLKEANQFGYPIWYKLYSARSAYSMPALRPQDWDKFIDEMTAQETVFNLYHKHYWKNSPRRGICDGECRKRLICDARSGRSHDRRALCGHIEARIDGTSPAPQTWRAWFYNGLSVSMSMIMQLPQVAYQIPKFVLGLG